MSFHYDSNSKGIDVRFKGKLVAFVDMNNKVHVFDFLMKNDVYQSLKKCNIA